MDSNAYSKPLRTAIENYETMLYYWKRACADRSLCWRELGSVGREVELRRKRLLLEIKKELEHAYGKRPSTVEALDWYDHQAHDIRPTIAKGK